MSKRGSCWAKGMLGGCARLTMGGCILSVRRSPLPNGVSSMQHRAPPFRVALSTHAAWRRAAPSLTPTVISTLKAFALLHMCPSVELIEHLCGVLLRDAQVRVTFIGPQQIGDLFFALSTIRRTFAARADAATGTLGRELRAECETYSALVIPVMAALQPRLLDLLERDKDGRNGKNILVRHKLTPPMCVGVRGGHGVCTRSCLASACFQCGCCVCSASATSCGRTPACGALRSSV